MSSIKKHWKPLEEGVFRLYFTDACGVKSMKENKCRTINSHIL